MPLIGVKCPLCDPAAPDASIPWVILFKSSFDKLNFLATDANGSVVLMKTKISSIGIIISISYFLIACLMNLDFLKLSKIPMSASYG